MKAFLISLTAAWAETAAKSGKQLRSPGNGCGARKGFDPRGQHPRPEGNLAGDLPHAVLIGEEVRMPLRVRKARGQNLAVLVLKPATVESPAEAETCKKLLKTLNLRSDFSTT